MKKIQISILMVLLAAVIAVGFSLAGCSKKQSSQDTANGSGASNGGSGQRSSFSIDSYKQQLDNELASLVQDGTITSDQEDKIIDAYANMFSSRMADRPSGSFSRPSGSGNGSRPSWNGSRPSGSFSRPSGSGGSRPSFSGSRPSGAGGNFPDPLASLVKDKTITQAQSDAVTKALSQGFGGFGRGGASSQSQQ